MEPLLRLVRPDDLPDLLREPVDAETLAAARSIVDGVRTGGKAALRGYAEKFGDVEQGGPLVLGPEELRAAYEALPVTDQQLLRRVADRIRTFAAAQRASIQDLETAIPGGVAGHEVSPVAVAGCYAPGGRFPLPSSMLMTAVTARAAGVKAVVAASPKAPRITQAAAHVAGVDMLLTFGGAHAIAAMAHGIEGFVPRCDAVVGPGNRWVTAAKQIVSGTVAIDMLAGPSELVILADGTASPVTVAADLLAQAEHDPDALPVLVTTSRELALAAGSELATQLETLPTRETAEASLRRNGFAVVAASLEEAFSCVNRLAPEHLELLLEDPSVAAGRVNNYGGLFVGAGAAEVLGDYGAGPNHTLPTGTTARFTGGLSVFNFLRIRTWMRIDSRAGSQGLVEDSILLARHEGLEGHARSAMQRRLD